MERKVKSVRRSNNNRKANKSHNTEKKNWRTLHKFINTQLWQSCRKTPTSCRSFPPASWSLLTQVWFKGTIPDTWYALIKNVRTLGKSCTRHRLKYNENESQDTSVGECLQTHSVNRNSYTNCNLSTCGIILRKCAKSMSEHGWGTTTGRVTQRRLLRISGLFWQLKINRAVNEHPQKTGTMFPRSCRNLPCGVGSCFNGFSWHLSKWI